MGSLYDDVVIVRQSEKEGEASVITVNCPDKTGLGCDLCRLFLFFGLTILKVDVSPDGKWCYIVFWVIGKLTTRWGLLKKRLVGACPSCSSASGISFNRSELLTPKPPDVFLVKFCCFDRRGLLHDVTVVLCKLELTIRRVKVSTTPDGRVMDLLYITDTRLDNSLSPAHTLAQIVCQDHKGLLYDIMRTLKDYNIQKRNCEVDLFIMQADGKKIVDPSKQAALCSRIRTKLLRPLRVALVNRGPDTELLVANPVELSGKGRPLVFYDITLALKMLNTGIFLAEIGRHMIGDRKWEVYRVLLDEGDGFSVPKKQIEETVWKMLMGFEL